MKLALCLYIFGVSFVLVCEQAEVDHFLVDADLRTPLLSLGLPTHAEQAGSVAGSRVSLVLGVQPVVNLAKIHEAVAGWVAVDVVDMCRGPAAIGYEPRQPVRTMPGARDNDVDVAFRMPAACDISDAYGVVFAGSASDDAGVGVVGEQLPRPVCTKIGSSHDAVLSLIGQRPGSVGSAARASLFSVAELPGSTRGDLDGGRLDH